jgi:2-dehydro-3-deoxygluconokinase
VTDLVTVGETGLRLSAPRGERLETAGEFDVTASGAESNVAVAAARLGLDAAWLSKLPSTPLGRRVVTELRAHGVRTGVVWADEGRVGTRYLERGGDPRGRAVVSDRTGSAAATATAEELPLSVVRNASTVFTSGATPALSERAAETTAALLEVAADADTTTAFDLNYRSERWSRAAARECYEALLPAVDVLFAARPDVENVLGVEGDPVEAANHLASRFDLRTVVVTLGDRGALGLHGGEAHEQPTFAVDTRDSTGTSDAFVGGFLAESLRGAGLGDALAFGAATAALARTVDGDLAVVTREEVERVVDEGTEGFRA